MVESKEHTCCFFGHRKIDVTDELVNRLKEVVEDLITEKKGLKILNIKNILSL